ncbi:MAG TPA: transglycosylase SLT domain-containing protein [Gemmatimonadales bacterium]|nr:transglycosylase SLT domain-containing protein [Gemmatimonadales bacterium]
MPFDPNISERASGRRLVLRGALIAGGVLVIGSLAGLARGARANDDATAPSVEFASREVGQLRQQLEAARGDLEVARVAADRAHAVIRYSGQFQIPADLAAAIYDVALSEGIDPRIGFRLVQVESNFKRGARSGAAAIGYTQVRLPTARFYQVGITERQLYDRETNLRIGFRFLRDLLKHFDGDLRLALLAYNRGPQRVKDILAAGGDPSNGYASAVMGLKRKPVVQPAAVVTPPDSAAAPESREAAAPTAG